MSERRPPPVRTCALPRPDGSPLVFRYAMSVVWELDAQTLAVTKVWFGRTLIRSSYQLHYELAQALLNGEQVQVPELARLGPEERSVRLAELVEALETLTRVARHLRAQRDRGGALELEGVEVKNVLVSEGVLIRSSQ